MIYYKMQMTLNENIEGVSEETKSKDYALLGTTLNRVFESMKYKEIPVVAYVSDLDDENVVVIFAKRSEDAMERVQREIQDKAEHSLNVSVTVKSMSEITVEEFRNGISDSHCNGYLRNYRNVTNDLKIDYENNHCFSVKEGIVVDEKLSKKQAKKNI